MKTPAMLAMYRHLLERFCFYNAEIERMTEMISRGLNVDRRRLVYAGYQAGAFRADLLEAKALMGYDDGLDFMGDNTFVDFRITDGKLYGGSKEGVYAFTERWVCDFPFESFNHYRFEVSIFARCLADPGYIPEEDAYPEALHTAAVPAAA